MANVKTHLNKILSSVYGKDVRGAIHDAIDAINNQVETTTQSEARRVSAETERERAEQTRNTSEVARNQQENARQQAENERARLETLRQSQEQTRQNAENSRAQTERVRNSSEDQRKQAEQLRLDAETERINAEELRKQAETGRQQQEQTRTQQTQQIQTTLEAKIREMDEKLRDTESVTVDATLTQEGQAADAKKVGEALQQLNNSRASASQFIFGEIEEVRSEGSWHSNETGFLQVVVNKDGDAPAIFSIEMENQIVAPTSPAHKIYETFPAGKSIHDIRFVPILKNTSYSFTKNGAVDVHLYFYPIGTTPKRTRPKPPAVIEVD